MGIHSSSPIAQFYPKEFTTDPNGKRQPWEHVVRIPFVDEELLLREVGRIVDCENNDGSDLLSERERKRNVMGVSKSFIPPSKKIDNDHEYAATTTTKDKVITKGTSKSKGRKKKANEE